MDVYFDLYGDMPYEQVNVLSTLLEQKGVGVHECTEEFPDQPTLLFFLEVNEQLLEHVREISQTGRQHTIGIACSTDVLKIEDNWLLLRAGISDILECDNSESELIEQIIERVNRWDAIETILQSDLVCQNLIGNSHAWHSTLRKIIEVSYFSTTPILLMGETGSGKEQVARLIHTLNPSVKKQKLVTLDCSTIVPELSGSEFFGHERGSFTGATEARDGAFAMADQGTLFLDEIGELPLNLQSQLLRAIQEHSYKRLGSNQWRHADFRLVCATNRDLEKDVMNGRFRSDLYYRIAGWVCKLPPLRKRLEDILLLASYFFKELCPDNSAPELSSFVSHYLLQREYPGNIRELKQLITRIHARHVGSGRITVGDLPEDEWPSVENEKVTWRNELFIEAIRQALTMGAELKEISQHATELAINIAVTDEAGNLQRAAKKLGVTDRALQMRRANRRQ